MCAYLWQQHVYMHSSQVRIYFSVPYRQACWPVICSPPHCSKPHCKKLWSSMHKRTFTCQQAPVSEPALAQARVLS